MPLPSHILAFTDMSARSDRAVRRALDLARTHDLPVTVVSVLDDAMPPDLTEVLHGRARTEIERFVADAARGTPYRIDLRVGDPTEELLKTAAADPEALLVMGVHRPRPFLDGLRETTMQRIVRRAGNPALLVADRVDHPYARIVAPTDFSPASTASMTLAHTLAPQAALRLFHALHVPYSGMLEQTPGVATDIEKAFLKEAQEHDARWRASDTPPPEAAGETEIEVASPYVRLRKMADLGEVDLIAVGAHGRVGAAPAILGSLATDLMRDPPCDVLIARP